MDAAQDNLAQARAHFLAALSQQEAEDWISAEQSLREAMRLAPGRESILVNLAGVLVAGQRWVEALSLCEQVCAENPASAEGWLNAGLCLQGLGRVDEALTAFGHSLTARPDNPAAMLPQARIHLLAGRHVEALAWAERVCQLDPSSATGWRVQGQVLSGMRRFDEALLAHRKALQQAPDWLDALLGAANAALDAGLSEEALPYLERARGLAPDSHEICHNLGNALAACGRWADAVSAYDRALVLRPGTALSVWNRALARLALGDYAGGFSDFEARWQSGLMCPHNVPGPLWQGESLEGKRLLVHAEQGFGDVLMYARFVRELARQGVRVQFAVHAALKPLLACLPGVEVVTGRERFAAYDYQCPVMSLPHALRVTLASLPARVPYLEVPLPYRVKWQARLGAASRQRIGLVFSGSDNGPYAMRAIPLAQLQALGELPAQFFVLQKDVGIEDRASWRNMPWLNDLGAELGDFADTAAAIEQLDLVISVDSAVLHLAGALGKPVWALLAYTPDWRWQGGDRDSPWYPSARLFRQAARNDWAGLVRERLLPALMDHLDTK
ncbi:MAG: glycosyltransferase 9 family protein [Proteobacteria bacterium]|nr:glycosyltransferase 9 family protein [Pseudomonadota bacterium]